MVNVREAGVRDQGSDLSLDKEMVLIPIIQRQDRVSTPGHEKCLKQLILFNSLIDFHTQ